MDDRMDDRAERKLTDMFGKPINGIKDTYDAEGNIKLCGDSEVDHPDGKIRSGLGFGSKLSNIGSLHNLAEKCEKVKYDADILALAGIDLTVSFEEKSASNQISSLMKEKYKDFKFDLSGDDCVLINEIPTKIQTGFLKDLYVGFTGLFGHGKAVKEICDVIETAMSELFLLVHTKGNCDE